MLSAIGLRVIRAGAVLGRRPFMGIVMRENAPEKPVVGLFSKFSRSTVEMSEPLCFQLSRLSSEELLSNLRKLVKRERELLVEVLEHLRVIEARKLYLEMNYPSLFEFAMGELGYCKTSAHLRISAMRLMKAVPEVKGHLEEGGLSLSDVSTAQGFFQREDLKKREAGEEKLSVTERREIVHELIGKSVKQAEIVLVGHLPRAEPTREKVRALTPERARLEFTVSREQVEKLETLRMLLSHRLPHATLEQLLEAMTEIALEQLDPERREARAQKRKAARSKKPPGRTAATGTHSTPTAPDTDLPSEPAADDKPDSEIPSSVLTEEPAPVVTTVLAEEPAVVDATLEEFEALFPDRSKSPGAPGDQRVPSETQKRAVWIRDQGLCTYRDSRGGRVCRSRYALEYDHLVPYALGGPTTVENLALRCGAHNRFRAERMGLGRKHRDEESRVRR